MSETANHAAHGWHPMTTDASSIQTHSMSMTQMTFTSSTDVVLLFDFWHPTTVLGMLVSCVIIFLMAATLEALRSFREALYLKPRVTSSSSSLLSSAHTSNHIIQTLLYGLQVTTSYLLMLLFMTFNGYVCFAIVLGATVGFLVFGWKKSPLMLDVFTDHCG